MWHERGTNTYCKRNLWVVQNSASLDVGEGLGECWYKHVNLHSTGTQQQASSRERRSPAKAIVPRLPVALLPGTCGGMLGCPWPRSPSAWQHGCQSMQWGRPATWHAHSALESVTQLHSRACPSFTYRGTCSCTCAATCASSASLVLYWGPRQWVRSGCGVLRPLTPHDDCTLGMFAIDRRVCSLCLFLSRCCRCLLWLLE